MKRTGNRYGMTHTNLTLDEAIQKLLGDTDGIEIYEREVWSEDGCEKLGYVYDLYVDPSTSVPAQLTGATAEDLNAYLADFFEEA